MSLQKLGAGEALFTEPVGGAELLILQGELESDEEKFGKGSWLRLPPGKHPSYTAGPQGLTLYLKTGHLADIENP